MSHLLLLNRRGGNVEPTLFAAELEKFQPYQQRLASTVHHQEIALQEVAQLWHALKDLAGKGPGAKKWDDREKKKRETLLRFAAARENYLEVRDGLACVSSELASALDLTSVQERAPVLQGFNGADVGTPR